MINDIPCKDCICFPICKAQAHEYMNYHKNGYILSVDHQFVNSMYYMLRNLLIKKCDIIKDWIYNPSYTSKRFTDCMNDIQELFFTQTHLDNIEELFRPKGV